jgi:glycosyltransferase A (GT-A) superfamily protein (DUF2064 family)
MAPAKKNDSVIAICIQEPSEDGSTMELGAIKGDELRFLHQAFITDSITQALEVPSVDVRLYYIDNDDRKRLVTIITNYLKKKLTGNKATAFKSNFKAVKLSKERWGKRVEKVFEECFNSGYKHVLVVGSRTPTVLASKMKTALNMLKKGDAVFGPTPEGRYYAIGMSKKYSVSLSKYDWKSPTIYSEVSDAFTNEGLAWAEMEIWYCVEGSDELELMVRDINQWRFEGDDEIARETEIVLERIFAKLGG